MRVPVANVDWAYLLPICLVATLGGLLFGYDTGVISGTIESLTQRFQLDDFMKGWASGCVLIGCAMGALLVGPISDRFGRKKALFLSAVLFLLSAIGMSLPRDIVTFILFRILGGIATTSFANYLIAGHGDQAWNIATGWRWMFAMGILPAVAFFLLLLRIPESPRWLIEKRRNAEAREVLRKVGGSAFADGQSACISASLAGEKGTWSELFSRRLRLPLMIGIALAVLQQVTGINVFMYFGATIFKTMSQSTGVDAGLLQQIIINGSGVLFTLIAIASVDKWGRRPLMFLGTSGMGVSLVAMDVMAQTMSVSAATSHLMLACIILYIACFGLSVGPVIWVILSEIFPTAVRGRALGVATFCLWLSDYVVTQTFPLMDAKGSWFAAHFNHAFPFYMYAGFCAVLIAVMWLFVPETKGRSLEEIERCWHHES